MSEKTDFVPNYLPYLVGRAGFEINRSFNLQLKENGIQPGEWRVLAALSDRGMTVNELARIVLLKQPTLTKLLDSMQANGQIARSEHPDDRRKVAITLTTSGKRLATRLKKLARKHEADVLSKVPALADPSVVDALESIIATLGKK